MGFQPPYDQDEEQTFLERHRVVLSVVAIVVIGLGVTFMAKKTSGGGSSRKGSDIVSVRLPPPAPTPPPPPSTPPPVPEMKQEQKMMEQAPVNENEDKPKDEPPPDAPISTGIKGDGGSDAFGVGGGRGTGLIGGGAGSQRSKYGWYAALVQRGIQDALKNTPSFRNASASLTVRIWTDATGRVTRVKVKASDGAGDAQYAQSIQEALTGVQLKEAPPAGLPQPIVMKVTAKRPN